MKKKINGYEYDFDVWRARFGLFGMPDEYTLSQAKDRRLPLPDEIKEQRRAHMLKLKEGGAPVYWIAKLYRMSRKQVTRIIKNLPNR